MLTAGAHHPSHVFLLARIETPVAHIWVLSGLASERSSKGNTFWSHLNRNQASLLRMPPQLKKQRGSIDETMGRGLASVFLQLKMHIIGLSLNDYL